MYVICCVYVICVNKYERSAYGLLRYENKSVCMYVLCSAYGLLRYDNKLCVCMWYVVHTLFAQTSTSHKDTGTTSSWSVKFVGAPPRLVYPLT